MGDHEIHPNHIARTTRWMNVTFWEYARLVARRCHSLISSCAGVSLQNVAAVEHHDRACRQRRGEGQRREAVVEVESVS